MDNINEQSVEVIQEKSNDEMYVSKSEFNKLYKKIKRIEIMSVVGLIFLVVILAMSFVNQPESINTVVEGSSEKKLPSTLNKSEIDALGNEVVEIYNAGDYVGLYYVLGDYAQTLVPIEDFKKSMDGIKVLGKIQKYSFSHHKFEGTDDGADWYTINYIANYDMGNGKLQLTLRVTGDEWEVAGMHMEVKNMDLGKLED